MIRTHGEKTGRIFLDLGSGGVLLMAIHLSWKMLRWIPFRDGPDPQMAVLVLMVLSGVLVLPIALIMHIRASVRASHPVSLLRAFLEAPPVRPAEHAAWWWARVATGAWIASVLANPVIQLW
jgi:hypothetical protein